MLNGRTKTKLLLCSSASLCLIAASIAAPTRIAQQNEPQPNWSAPLNTLNDVQKTYASPGHGLGNAPIWPRAARESGRGLRQIRSDVLQVRSSDKVPQDLLHTTLIAIDEAQTALGTTARKPSHRRCRPSGSRCKIAVEAHRPAARPRPRPGASTTNPGVGTRAPDQASRPRPEQKGPRVAEAEHTTGVTPQILKAPTRMLKNA